MNTAHNFLKDRFNIYFRTPLGNIVDAAEAQRIHQLAEDTKRLKAEKDKPPEREGWRKLRENKEQL